MIAYAFQESLDSRSAFPLYHARAASAGHAFAARAQDDVLDHSLTGMDSPHQQYSSRLNTSLDFSDDSSMNVDE
jgi:hypothetical protein